MFNIIQRQTKVMLKLSHFFKKSFSWPSKEVKFLNVYSIFCLNFILITFKGGGKEMTTTFVIWALLTHSTSILIRSPKVHEEQTTCRLTKRYIMYNKELQSRISNIIWKFCSFFVLLVHHKWQSLKKCCHRNTRWLEKKK